MMRRPQRRRAAGASSGTQGLNRGSGATISGM
jgi:hypothetical protein